IQYAAWGRSVSPGQLSLAAATRLRGREPMVLGLVGHPLGHSLSPAIHEAALSALDVPGVYLPFDCDAESLDSLLEAAERDHVRGGAKVQVTNRTMRRADALADSFDESVEAIPLDALARGGPWDLLVNATPLGTREAGPGLPVPASILAKVAHVYDLVYDPLNTPLLEAARRLGKPTTSGLEMLLHQAAQSFELWTGRAPPVEPMRRVAK